MGDMGSAGDALVSLIAAQTEQTVYDVVTEAVHELLPGSMVICSVLMPSGDEFRVTAMAGVDGYLGRVIALVGLDPTTISYGMADRRPEDLASYRSGRLEKVPGGLYTLSLRKIPKPGCAALERLLGIEEVFAIGFAWRDLHVAAVERRVLQCLRTEDARLTAA